MTCARHAYNQKKYTSKSTYPSIKDSIYQNFISDIVTKCTAITHTHTHTHTHTLKKNHNTNTRPSTSKLYNHHDLSHTIAGSPFNVTFKRCTTLELWRSPPVNSTITVYWLKVWSWRSVEWDTLTLTCTWMKHMHMSAQVTLS